MNLFGHTFITVCLIFGFTIAQNYQGDTAGQRPSMVVEGQPLQGTPFDEVVVESNLNVRKKQVVGQRKSRSIYLLDGGQQLSFQPVIRVKRQRHRHRPHRPDNDDFTGFQQPNYSGSGFGQPFGDHNYGASQSSANAASQSVGFGPNGFGGAAAEAQAQGFQANGPLGGFGASATNAGTQGFQFGPHGLQGSAGLSGTQTYNLPNGHALNIAYTDGFSLGTDGNTANSNANSITYT